MQHAPLAYIRMLQRAQDLSSEIIGDQIDVIEKHLVNCNAFKEHDQAALKIIRMEKGMTGMPSYPQLCNIKNAFQIMVATKILSLSQYLHQPCRSGWWRALIV